ncbi:MAG: hypothetical protein CM15mP47_3410 [Methanobacteriota archaeon]|nr:MAG: hypothetical protein CM15mP47_3410 [Euryarchaeota archaeon]
MPCKNKWNKKSPLALKSCRLPSLASFSISRVARLKNQRQVVIEKVDATRILRVGKKFSKGKINSIINKKFPKPMVTNMINWVEGFFALEVFARLGAHW